MKYRPFWKLVREVSALGFDAMRLPKLDGDSSTINGPEATLMLHYAIEQGINYIDTAYIYPGGNSEIFLGKALKNRSREKVKIATKLPFWIVNKSDDFNLILDDQFNRLQTDSIDVYLRRGLNQI